MSISERAIPAKHTRRKRRSCLHNTIIRGGAEITPKKYIISCRMGDTEYQKIVNVARQLNIKKSDVIKLSLNDSLSKYRPIRLSKSERQSMLQNRRNALDKLGKVSTEASTLSRRWLLAGNNINQIAHRSNIKDGQIDFALNNSIEHLTNQLSSEQLKQQNNLLIRRLTEIWQLLE